MNSSHQEENNQNTLPSDYTELDLAKIREFMYKSTILLSYNSAILEEHQRKCEENENFLEAEAARDRIGEFKKIEEAKLKIETSKEFEKQVIIHALNIIHIYLNRENYLNKNKMKNSDYSIRNLIKNMLY